MPGTPLAGNAAGFNRGAALATTGPADGEGIDAADLNTPLQAVLDMGEDYRTLGAKTDEANTFTVPQTISTAVLATQPLLSLACPLTSTWQLVEYLNDTVAAKSKSRRYMGSDGTTCITTNAAWDDLTSKWIQDDALNTSTRVKTALNNSVWEAKPAGSAPWDDGLWDGSAYLTSTGFRSINGLSSDAAISAGAAVSAGAPTPTPAFSVGTLYGDTIPVAWAVFVTDPAAGGTATLYRGANIASVARTGPGAATVTLNAGVGTQADGHYLCPIATAFHGNGFCSAGGNAAGNQIVTQLFNTGGGVVDGVVCLVVFGG